jgi:hypothetical protein
MVRGQQAGLSPRAEAYLRKIGPAGAAAAAAFEHGERWEWNPIAADDICPLDDSGVCELVDGADGWREVWHVDGIEVDGGALYHVCHRGHHDRGWEHVRIAVDDPAFPARLASCEDNEARWQSWRRYYQHVLDTGLDPVGVFLPQVRDLARLALAELGRPLAQCAPGP